MKALRNLLALLLVLAIGLGAWVYSGTFDVSSAASPSAVEDWLLSTIKERSIARHARGIEAPLLSDPARVRQGFELFRSQCVTCHGAPGVSPDDLAMGLTPVPPSLDFPRVQKATDGELYWVIKNGIKFTGMPGFGFANSEEDIWSLVAFMRRLPELKPSDFESMAMSETEEEPAGPAPATADGVPPAE